MKKNKISALLVLLFSVCLSVPQGTYGYAQIQSRQNKLSMSEVLKRIKTESGYRLFYSETDMKSLVVEEDTIDFNSIFETLARLKELGVLDYEINADAITIRKKTKTAQVSGVPNKTEKLQPADSLAFFSPKELDEIVLIGYSSQKKKNVTGAISSIKSSDLEAYSGGDFSQMLSGKVAGLQVVQGQGIPGAKTSLKLRGTSTLTAGSEPLIVVDGFPLSEGTSLNMIDPNTIESVEFLKDAASTAIYGSRGANGVIVIQSKIGKKTTMNIQLSTYTAMQERADRVKLLDAYEFAQFQYQARNNGYVSKDPLNRSVDDSNAIRSSKGASKRELIPEYLWPYLNKEAGLTNTDWLKEIFRKAPMQNYSLLVSGGTEDVKYAFSGNYFKQEGIVIGSDFEKFSNNININAKLSDRVQIGVTVNPSYSSRNTFNPKGGWNTNIFDIALISYPYFSPYNPDGSLSISHQIDQNLQTDGALSENPVAIAQMVKLRETDFRIFGNTFLDYELVDGLNYTFRLGGDYQHFESNFFDPSTVGKYRTAAPDNTTANRTNYSRRNYLVENLLSFKKTLGMHRIEAIAGQSYQFEEQSLNDMDAFDFPDDAMENISGGSSFKINTKQYSWTMISYFSRLNYTLNQKYLFSASLRRDGSSRFGSDSKWGVFPAFSVGWVASHENFFPQNDVLSYLKFRGSWGKSGNNQIPNFGSIALLKESNYLFDDNLAPGYATATSPNPNLSWEMSTSKNIGIDLNLFSNLVSFSADYYVTHTNNLLLNVPVPYQSGYSKSLQNIGRVKSWGTEFQLSTARPISYRGLDWSASVNLSANRNRVLALAEGQEEIIAGASGYAITRVGGGISEMYGYKIQGVYSSQQQIDDSPALAGTLVGDYIMEDTNGDGKIDSSDKRSFGSAAPKFILGFNNSFAYKGLELTVGFNGEFGKKIYSRTQASLLESGEGFSLASREYYDNRFDPISNPNGKYAAPNLGNYSNNRKEAAVSDLFFKDASYLRLRTLKLAYSLPEQVLSNTGIAKVQFYVMGNNLYTWTPYKGFNVDGNSDDPLAQGYDNANYPTARTYTLGVNLNF